jgi:signal transduction histidine kinase
VVTVEELRRVALFDGLTDEELRRVVEGGSEKVVRAGEINGREGEPAEHLYVILSGELRITKRADGGEVVLNVYGPGQFFAEVPLLAGTPFLASGRALSECRMFLIPREDFQRMLTTPPRFAQRILETMAERVQMLQSVASERQRLNSLGTLAAGLAHELNNPASAARGAARDLRGSFERTKRLAVKLGRHMPPGCFEKVAALESEALLRAEDPPVLDPLARGEREDEVALWLEGRGVEGAWNLSPIFVAAGVSAEWLASVEEALPGKALPYVLEYLGATLETEALLGEAVASTGRVSWVVEAMKAYSNMDRAPLGEVDVNEGLEDTLAVLGYKLGGGIEVRRDYDPKLPRITAYGGELNQVWTNLLDNAIDAAGGSEGIGRIGLRTGCEGDGILVEISDDGPGVPEELRARVFEPFFTTKGVGEGSGLGLDVAYRIVVGRHGGDIRLVSRPGDTRFQVRLPLAPAEADGVSPEGTVPTEEVPAR